VRSAQCFADKFTNDVRWLKLRRATRAHSVFDSENMIAALLESIGALWKLVLALGFLLALILAATMFRRPCQVFLGRLVKLRIKRGNTEVSINDESLIAPDATPAVREQESAPPTKTQKTGTESKPASQVLETDWEIEMWLSFSKEDLKGAEKAYAKLQEAETNPEKRLENEAWYLSMRFRKGDADAQKKLESLQARGTEYPKLAGFLRRLKANYFAFNDDHQTAALIYEEAAAVSEGKAERARNLRSAAASLVKISRSDRAREILTKELRSNDDPEAQAELYLGLADTYDANSETRAVLLEKAVSNKPNSKQMHFDSAYAYAQAGLQPLAVLHYEKAIEIDSKHPNALNNLGVAFANLGAKKLAVDFYKRAIELGETLSSANLAYILIEAGEIEEARQILKEARKKEEVHGNVNQAAVRLEEVERENNERREHVVNLATALRQFLVTYADKLHQGMAANVNGSWRSTAATDISVVLDETNSKIEIHWTVRSDQKFRFTGKLLGQTSAGEVSKFKKDPFAGLFGTDKNKGSFERVGSGRLYFSNKCAEITMFWMSDGYEEKVELRFTRSDQASSPPQAPKESS